MVANGNGHIHPLFTRMRRGDLTWGWKVVLITSQNYLEVYLYLIYPELARRRSLIHASYSFVGSPTAFSTSEPWASWQISIWTAKNQVSIRKKRQSRILENFTRIWSQLSPRKKRKTSGGEPKCRRVCPMLSIIKYRSAPGSNKQVRK